MYHTFIQTIVTSLLRRTKLTSAFSFSERIQHVVKKIVSGDAAAATNLSVYFSTCYSVKGFCVKEINTTPNILSIIIFSNSIIYQLLLNVKVQTVLKWWDAITLLLDYSM